MYIITKTKCHRCKQIHEVVLHKKRYKKALRKDTFFCEKCSQKITKQKNRLLLTQETQENKDNYKKELS
jgi:predicted SprT family Zn-dependent metalloprotease